MHKAARGHIREGARGTDKKDFCVSKYLLNRVNLLPFLTSFSTNLCYDSFYSDEKLFVDYRAYGRVKHNT